jgi:hypothetical protein
MDGSRRVLLSVTVLTLKLLAFAVVLRPVLMRHASKVVTVFTQPVAGGAGPHAPRAYTYFTGFHLLDFSDIRWGLLLGVALYLMALAIQLAASGRLATRTPQHPPAA